MRATRRDLIRLGALAAAGSALPTLAWGAGPGAAAKPLRILILGGTGFTGPFQVNYALARGHKVTLFNESGQSGRGSVSGNRVGEVSG